MHPLRPLRRVHARCAGNGLAGKVSHETTAETKAAYWSCGRVLRAVLLLGLAVPLLLLLLLEVVVMTNLLLWILPLVHLWRSFI